MADSSGGHLGHLKSEEFPKIRKGKEGECPNRSGENAKASHGKLELNYTDFVGSRTLAREE
jgi:hypothetical protein